MRVVLALAAAALAAVGLSACGSSRPTPAHVSAPPPVKVDWPGTVLFVRGAPSHGLGIDNTDLLVATPNGGVRDLTSSASAESNTSWSADGSHVVFTKESTTGDENGTVAFHYGIYTWSPGHGAPKRIASCSTECARSEFAWSPNDRQIAFLADDMNGPAIKVMNGDGSGVHTVCEGKRCGYGLDSPLWSPDGRKLVFSNESTAPFRQGATGGPPTFTPISNVWIANADGSGVKQLTQPACKAGDRPSRRCSVDRAPAWSPNGKLIAFRRDSHVDVMHADGSDVHSIARCRVCDLDPRLVWTPDGTAVAYPANRSFRITTLAGKTRKVDTCVGSHCVSPEQLTWSPSGDQLAFFAGGDPLGGGVWAIGRDGEAMHRIATGAENCCLAWAQHVSLRGAKAIPKLPAARHLNLSGTIAYENSSGVAFLSLGTSGGPKLQQTSIDGLDPTLSPDGREIAYGGVGSPIPVANIYVSDRNGGNVRVLTHSKTGDTSPTWSPDGRTIVFNGNLAVGLVSAAGGPIRSVAAQAGISQSWNPSGSELLFERQVGSGSTYRAALFTVHPNGRGLHRLTKLPGSQDWAAWSPDGREIAFGWTSPSGTGGVYLVHPDGTHLRRLTTARLSVDGSPTWSPNSRYLAAFSYSGAATDERVLVIDVNTGRFSTVATVPQHVDDGQPSWSRH